ncbi:MerR family transcriptional regulator [Amycolatopsis rhabdoformis]|uniref:MerR family transcriptional regulator n=1 Tax=Amycolatopsis rhabdoformis TaxID=1448059 RepID=A0ABZ1IIQ1_9PSEU|nr:MerR family transcriptional regulator [Amycolatopsis rhabdoformis]WSE33543.1 MerR family transcriptional regulator [Amycolatopsis rhabdoformis]
MTMSLEPTTPDGETDGLLPIHVVCRQFGIKASTLRYYEQRGLLAPRSRRGGRRWYGPQEVRRLAIILFWQRSGLMSLDVIEEILERSTPGGQWRDTVAHHVHDLHERIERMRRVEAFVTQSLECAHHECLDECPDYEELVWDALELVPPGEGADIAAIRQVGSPK